MEHHLCKICRVRLQGNLKLGTWYDHHGNIDEFRSAVNSKCCICSAAWDSLERQFDNLETVPGDVISLASALAVKCRPDRLVYRVRWIQEREQFGRIPCQHEYELYLLDDNTMEELSIRRELPQSTGSEDTFSVVRQWLSTCLANQSGDHQNCAMSLSPTSYSPSRLIYCGQSGDHTAKLCEAEELEESSHYVSLSHRWGSDSTLKLTTKTFDDFKRSMSLEMLPRTFQDAIFVTRSLGFSYIWIDSLCIIQDSDEDGQQEAAKMGDYYGNAVLNIAASGAPSDENGLFVQRIPESIWTQEVKVIFNTDASMDSKSSFPYIYAPTWDNLVERSPLTRRCWIYQERLLSPRILHYTSAQIFWQCRAAKASEVCPDGLPFDWRDANINGLSSRLASTTYQAAKAWHQEWAGVVQSYSRGRLTIESDKLIAISGIASIFHHRCQDEYLAGLWKSSLPQYLTWQVFPMTTLGMDLYPCDSNAPSWSWASVKARVMFPSIDDYDKSTLYATLIDYSSVQLRESAPFGRVADACIRIRCLLKKAALVAPKMWSLDGAEPFKVMSFFDMEEPCSCGASENSAGSIKHTVSKECLTYLMPIFDIAPRQEDSDLYGLILIATSQHEGEFKRIGMFRARGPPKAVLTRRIKWIQRWEYEGFDSTEDCTVTIV